MSFHAKDLRALVVGVVVALTTTVLAMTPVAAQQSPSPTPPPHALEKSHHGEDAINALGDRLPEVAAAHGINPGQLKKLFRTDETLWVDPNLALFYVEPPLDTVADAAATPDAAASTPYPLADTFLLHSDSTSTHTIYLDFDGQEFSGSNWSDGYPVLGDPFSVTPFSIDADPGFSPAEQAMIQSVWQRVSENYAPFDVDVTTEDPGAAALDKSDAGDQYFGTRVSIAGSDTVAYPQTCGACGGFAYVGHFGSVAYQPAFVFQKGLGGVTATAKNIAEAASHEAGHNLGLNHDGTSTAGYYTGHGAWAPIMGVGYYKPLVQWSKGEYPDANNAQDDLAIIGAAGLTTRTDSDGTNGTANNLGTPAPTVNGAGVISSRNDVDVYRFDLTQTELVTIRANPAPTSPDLDISLTLQDASGTPVDSADPASAMVSTDVASGLDAEISTTLAAGTYYVHVDGVGYGDTSTGYTDYASLGRYDVEVLSGVCALGDESTDDDTLGTARAAGPGQTKTGTSCDEDWYLDPGNQRGGFDAPR